MTLFVLLSFFLSTSNCVLLTQIGHLYESSAFIDDVNSIAIDTSNKNIYAANTASGTIDIISYDILHDSQDDDSQASLAIIRSIDIHLQASPYFVLDYITSITYSPKGYIIATLIPLNYAQVTGWLVFIDVATLYIEHFIELKHCYSPKHVVSTSDATKLVIACEGLADGNTADPEGSVSVVDISSDDASDWRIYNVDFTQFDSNDDDDTATHHKPLPQSIYEPRSDSAFSVNAEPEYVAIDDEDRYAYVVLQENNGVAILDIEQLEIVTIFGFGAHDFGYSGFDPSDLDNGIAINKYANVYALRQPDGISYYRSDSGSRYILTANEGNPKYYDMTRVSEIELDAEAFPNRDMLQEDEYLGRLQVLAGGAKYGENDDGEFSAIYTFGSRDFAIWEVEKSDDEECPCEYPYGLRLAYSSYDDFEQITAAVLGEKGFNSDLFSPSGGARSDDKGPEPESIVVGQCNNGDSYVFIGLERVGGIMVYDITDVDEGDVTFVEYLNTRDFDVIYDDDTRPPQEAGDVEPETLLFVTDDDDDDIAYLIVGYKTSASIAIYSFHCGINRAYDKNTVPSSTSSTATTSTADDCSAQAPCLNVAIRPILSADIDEMYQVCVEFNDENPFCDKSSDFFEYGMTLADEAQLDDALTPLQWFSNDAICETATCDAVVQFAIKDGEGCSASSALIVDIDGIPDVDCEASEIMESCKWSIPTPRCTTSTTTAAATATTQSIDNQDDDTATVNNQYGEENKKETANRNTFDTMTNKGGHFYESTMFYMLLTLCLLTCLGIIGCVYKHSKYQSAQIEGDAHDVEDVEDVEHIQDVDEHPVEFED